MMKFKLLFFVLFSCVSSGASAQLTYGTTGLLHAPSAEMQRDKTVMIGGNFMNKELTPPTWYYHTYNYFLNVTIFPWMEVAYTCTLFKAEALGLGPYGYTGFTNQDRYFSPRLTFYHYRLLKSVQCYIYHFDVLYFLSNESLIIQSYPALVAKNASKISYVADY